MPGGRGGKCPILAVQVLAAGPASCRVMDGGGADAAAAAAASFIIRSCHLIQISSSIAGRPAGPLSSRADLSTIVV